jgi:glutamyl-tRNA synthetase
LLWLNQHYLKTSDVTDVAKELAWHMQQLQVDISHGPALEDIIKAQCERSKTLREMAEKSLYFYNEVEYNSEAVEQHLTQEALPALSALQVILAKLPDWNKDTIHQALLTVVEKLGVKLGKVAQPVRVAVTGNTVSPSVDLTLFLLGRELTLQRLEAAKKYCIN